MTPTSQTKRQTLESEMKKENTQKITMSNKHVIRIYIWMGETRDDNGGKNKILHVFFQMQIVDMGKHTHMLLECIKGLLLGKTGD